MAQISVAERVLGVINPEDEYRSFVQAYEILTGGPYDPYDRVLHAPQEPRLQGDWYEGLSQTEKERSAACGDVLDLLSTGKTRSTSTFTDWHNYSDMMNRYGTKADGNAKALMIGALSPLSSRSFQCMASDIYGADTAIIVDPVTGADKRRHGLFVQGDGLALPFRDGSMDFVHTNRLLHMLVDRSSPSSSTLLRIRKLILEIARVLAPGGQVLMHETLPDHRTRKTQTPYEMQQAEKQNRKVCEFIARALGQHGIGHTQTGLSETILGDERHLFDPKKDFSQYPKALNILVFTVYAKKQAQDSARPMSAR